MEFRILGPLEVIDDAGTRVVVGGGRERTLLALLLLSANRVVSSERLADDLWDGHPPPSAAHGLRVHLSRLRKALREAGAEGVLVTRPPGYLIDVDPGAVDATRFEALVAQARELTARGDHHQAAVTLQEALDLWRGPALADVADAPLARAEAARLEEARLAALEERVEADLACGRHGDLVGELDALTQAHPLRERLWSQRMVALYRAGRQAEALRVYQQLRTTLGEELGLEPSSTLRRLENAIVRQEPELDWTPASDPPQAQERGRHPSPAIPMPALLTDITPVFVGREHELAQFEALWADAQAGRHRLALVSGEPGVGKTRLAAELARRIHTDGSTVLAGRCDEDLGVPYQPFVEALRYFVDHTPAPSLPSGLGRDAGELVRIHPDLAARLPGLIPPLRTDPDTERYRLFESVAAWLAAAASERPILLILDDLQWATRPTLFLLRHVMRSAEPMHLLILGAYRDTEPGLNHPLADVLADFRRHAGVERLPLSGLDEADVARFLAESGGHDLDDDALVLARFIHTETEGNPFFVREVIRHLNETGRIERDGHWATGVPVDELGVPQGVRDVVGRRLARLSEHANQALRVAAVAGTEFEPSVVREAAGLKEDTLLAALEEAMAARLVADVPSPAPRHRFTHALVRDTLYGDLSAARRVAIHRQVAEAIETLHGALDDHLPALAYHWGRAATSAAETARAVHYATRAGDRALTQLAPDEAAAYYTTALELLRGTNGADADDPRRLELLISLGEAQRRAGDAHYRQTLLDAAHLARKLDDPDALARAALANTRGDIYSAALVVDTGRVAVLEAALAAAADDDLAIRARLLANLGMELAWEPDPGRRVTFSNQAVHLARSLDDPETLAHVLLARDYTITGPQNAAERLAATTEVLATAERLGDPVLTSRALILRFKAAMELAEVAEAQRCLARNQELVPGLGQAALTWAAMHHDATLRILHGDPGAEAAIIAAHEFGVASGWPDIVYFSGGQLVSLYLDQGRLDEVEQLLRQLTERTDYPMVKGAYAFILSETGHMEDATLLFDELAATGFAHPTNTVAWLRFAADCAWLCSRLGRTDCVPELRSRLAPYADQLVVISLGGVVSGSVAFYLGVLATTTADWPEADASFGAAAATHERIGAPTWLARTRLEWARMLLSRAEPGDGERAHELLRQALATAQELGLTNVERDTAFLLPTST